MYFIACKMNGNSVSVANGSNDLKMLLDKFFLSEWFKGNITDGNPAYISVLEAEATPTSEEWAEELENDYNSFITENMSTIIQGLENKDSEEFYGIAKNIELDNLVDDIKSVLGNS